MGTMGNTFDVNTVKYGHARKVWREIRHRYPGGGIKPIRTNRLRRLNQILPLLALMVICKKIFL